MSTTRRFHDLGNIAATVSSPSGGNAACRATNRTACFRLQNVNGVCGETRRTFMTVPLSSSPTLLTAPANPPQHPLSKGAISSKLLGVAVIDQGKWWPTSQKLSNADDRRQEIRPHSSPRFSLPRFRYPPPPGRKTLRNRLFLYWRGIASRHAGEDSSGQ